MTIPPPDQGLPQYPGPDEPRRVEIQPAPTGMAGPIFAGVGGVAANVPLSFLMLVSGGDLAARSALPAVLYAALIFLGGGALCFLKSRPTRGFAVGLMAGWALLSIVSAGICTGLSAI